MVCKIYEVDCKTSSRQEGTAYRFLGVLGSPESIAGYRVNRMPPAEIPFGQQVPGSSEVIRGELE